MTSIPNVHLSYLVDKGFVQVPSDLGRITCSDCSCQLVFLEHPRIKHSAIGCPGCDKAISRAGEAHHLNQCILLLGYQGLCLNIEQAFQSVLEMFTLERL